MTEMMVNSLNVDFLQDQTTVTLIKQGDPSPGRKQSFTAITVNAPISKPGSGQEGQLKRAVIEEAKRALQEAIRTLDNYAA